MLGCTSMNQYISVSFRFDIIFDASWTDQFERSETTDQLSLVNQLKVIVYSKGKFMMKVGHRTKKWGREEGVAASRSSYSLFWDLAKS